MIISGIIPLSYNLFILYTCGSEVTSSSSKDQIKVVSFSENNRDLVNDELGSIEISLSTSLPRVNKSGYDACKNIKLESFITMNI